MRAKPFKVPALVYGLAAAISGPTAKRSLLMLGAPFDVVGTVALQRIAGWLTEGMRRYEAPAERKAPAD
jgi:hypothetical protein